MADTIALVGGETLLGREVREVFGESSLGQQLQVIAGEDTESGKLTERIRRPNYGTLELEITVDDPKVYTRPWTVKTTQAIELDTELIDEICLENEKSYQSMVKAREQK